MSKKNSKPLEQRKSWEELEEYAEEHGIVYDHTCGGHRYHKTPNGGRQIAFSTHEKEPSKHLRSQVIREIKTAIGLIAACIFIGLWVVSHLI